jgi:hypothetical protein
MSIIEPAAPAAAVRFGWRSTAFDHATGHYVDNIVVFASLVGSR